MKGDKYPHFDTFTVYLDVTGTSKVEVTTIGGVVTSVDLIVGDDVVSTTVFDHDHPVYTDVDDIPFDLEHSIFNSIYNYKIFVKLISH